MVLNKSLSFSCLLYKDKVFLRHRDFIDPDKKKLQSLTNIMVHFYILYGYVCVYLEEERVTAKREELKFIISYKDLEIVFQFLVIPQTVLAKLTQI